MMTTHKNEILRIILLPLAMMAVLFASGCSVTPKQTADLGPPLHTAENTLEESTVYAADIYDPLEGFNRRAYTFNYYFDKFLFLPVVKGYEFIMPDYA